jgi:hypothetical protein
VHVSMEAMCVTQRDHMESCQSDSVLFDHIFLETGPYPISKKAHKPAGNGFKDTTIRACLQLKCSIGSRIFGLGIGPADPNMGPKQARPGAPIVSRVETDKWFLTEEKWMVKYLVLPLLYCSPAFLESGASI